MRTVLVLATIASAMLVACGGEEQLHELETAGAGGGTAGSGATGGAAGTYDPSDECVPPFVYCVQSCDPDSPIVPFDSGCSMSAECPDGWINVADCGR